MDDEPTIDGLQGRGDPGSILNDPAHVRGDLAMEAMAIKKGWVRQKRWGTGKTLEELGAIIASGKATLKDRAEFVALQNMQGNNPRHQLKATQVVLAMERQNQSDEFAAVAANMDPAGPQRIDRSPLELVKSMMISVTPPPAESEPQAKAE